MNDIALEKQVIFVMIIQFQVNLLSCDSTCMHAYSHITYKSQVVVSDQLPHF